MLKKLSMIAVLAAACGGGTKQDPVDPSATTPPTAGAKAGVQLALGEMKLVDVNKNKAVTIHADGTIEFEGHKKVKVTADGKIVKIDDGQVGFELLSDGSVKGPDGATLGMTIGADGVVTMGDKSISLDASGEVVGGNEKAAKMRVEGATSADLRRTAMFVLIALSTPGKVSVDHEAGEPAEATAEPATP